MPSNASPVSKLLRVWKAEPSIATSIEAWRDIPARLPSTVEFPDDLHPILVAGLKSQNISSLFTHQATAWENLRSGKHIIVVTGTASGKSLCYNLPILDNLMHDPKGRALYIFPTKALAQDQAAKIKDLHNLVIHDHREDPADDSNPSSTFYSVCLGIYDGDTPKHHRAAVRTNTRLLFSNPDMLHLGILPHHTNWAGFFSNLNYVVLDEAHVYRGVFGSHVANIIRRLKRIAKFYGSRPQFILTTATIANPAELAERLVEERISIIDEDGAGRGPKSFLIYNPPIIDRDLGLRRSALQESVRLAQDLLTYSVQTIIFGRSRRTVELILTYLRERSHSPGENIGASRKNTSIIRGYRSGYLPDQRREIERGLRLGEVGAVVATNALELGIDIGGMGAALMVGYPGTISGTWQQAGRAGRGDSVSIAVLVTTAAPLDQFLASHPDYFFERSPEHALINPDNLLILLDHFRCAAFELPFTEGDGFGSVGAARVREFLDFLQTEGVLHRSLSKYFWMADRYPAQGISLRSASANPVTLQVMEEDATKTIGLVDRASAYWMVHPNAIYVHEGETYTVEDLNLETNIAWLSRVNSDFYTIPLSEITIDLLEQFGETEAIGSQISYGEISVTSQITGYRKVRWYTHENLGQEELSMPATELLTTGYWLALDEDIVSNLRDQGLWRGDTIDYGSNWESQRQKARQRDHNTCQICGASESGRAHDVHHKTPFRRFSSFESANRLDNLVTLCPSCHSRAEVAVRVRSGLAGLAFTLGHLAPFFLMCDIGDLGVHSDPHSPITGGKPTIVLYDQVPDGIGFSQRLYELHQDLIDQARQLVTACECADGCPSCVGPGGENGLGGKRETIAILEALTSPTSP